MSSLLLEAKAALAGLKTSPKKKLGQHFLIDPGVLRSIAEALVPDAGESNPKIVEIGPGLGFLTRFLLEKNAAVTAVEKDRVLAEYLKTRFAGAALTVVTADLLDTDLEKDLGIRTPVRIAGNIPYHITSPIFEWLIAQRRLITRAVLTVQKEVADRVIASPGNKAWGSLSVFLGFYAEPKVLHGVPRRSFYPSPRVDSAVLRLDFLPGGRVKVADPDNFFKLVRKSFQKRRKTLLNSLEDRTRAAFVKKELVQTLKICGIDPVRRPETLSIAEWAVLSDRLIYG